MERDAGGEGNSPVRKAKSTRAATPKPLTAERIRHIAEHYVGQRESSAGMLRDVLERRLWRRLRSLDPEAAAQERATVEPLIELEVERLRQAGLIADERYAEMKARGALRAGRGMRRILRDLGRKGVESGTAQEALLGAAREMLGTDGGEATDVLREAEFEAADTYAQKRRFGPYRTEPLPEAWAERSRAWQREASAMSRAGFGADTIRRILDREPDED